jgi:hypothetical protein
MAGDMRERRYVRSAPMPPDHAFCERCAVLGAQKVELANGKIAILCPRCVQRVVRSLLLGEASPEDVDRFPLMRRLVDSPPSNLQLDAWYELYALAVDFEPDLMLELGRGFGNSTCVFTEAAHRVGGTVVSVGFDSERAWETRTSPRLLRYLGADWFAPLTILHADITETDFRPHLEGSGRTLVYWDAHGQDVAAAVFANVLPQLPRDNLVIVDDVQVADEEKRRPGWRRWVRSLFRPEHYSAGPFESSFDEIVPLWDYLRSNDVPFEHSSRWVTFSAPERAAVAQQAAE